MYLLLLFIFFRYLNMSSLYLLKLIINLLYLLKKVKLENYKILKDLGDFDKNIFGDKSLQ